VIETVSKYYVTGRGGPDRETAMAYCNLIGDALEARYEAGEILGYETEVMVTDEDYDDAGLRFARARMLDAAGSEPIVWVNVTFPAAAAARDGMEAITARFGLQAVVMDPWEGD